MKKETIKGFICGVVVTSLLTCTIAFADPIEKAITAVYNGIKIVVNGNEITPKDANGNVVEPFIYNGSTYLPVRAVANALGIDVGWDGNTNTVYFGYVPAYTLSNNSGIVATLNGQNVYGGELKFFTSQNKVDLMSKLENPFADNALYNQTIDGKRAVDVLIDTSFDELLPLKVPAQKAREIGLDKTESFFTNAKNDYDSYIQNGFGSVESYQNTLAMMGIDESSMKSILEDNTLLKMYFSYLVENDPEFNLTEADSKAYFENNYVKVKHILILSDNSESGDKEARETAENIIKKIKNGEDFESLVTEYNQDPGQKVDEGYIFTKGQMVPEFEEAAYALENDEYTLEPVKTSYGYHIIKRYKLSGDDPYYTQYAKEFKSLAQQQLFAEKTEQLVKESSLIKNTDVLENIEF